jgi:7,8-dihydro-6-hydroxymethylpterin-pyrophosphokinase
VRTSDKYAPRTIDIDILVVNRTVFNEDVWKYAYLAVPLAELLPDLTHSASGKTLADVAKQLYCSRKIRLRPDVALGASL